MNSEADAVVVGAGALGLSTGMHLAQLGRKNVVIVDRYEPGSQTSPRAAGLFKLIQPDPTRTELSRMSIAKAIRFEQETGVPLPVVKSGSLMVARTEEHAAMIRREVAQSRAWGIEVELIDAKEAHRLAPWLEPDGVKAVAHIPGDIYIEEPPSLLKAYMEAARRAGAEIRGDTRVTGIRRRDGRVEAVIISVGEIRTPTVVDAAGAWARGVAETAQGEVPVVPMRHQLFITEPMAGVSPEQTMARIIDTAVYVRPARGGLMLGGFEADPMPMDLRREPEDFTMADVPLDMRVLEGLEGTVEAQVPALRDATVQEHRGGLFTMTPDGRFLVGPVPGVPGLWTATGCNGSGFSASLAIGQVLAEWITHGEPSIDMSILDPARFVAAGLSDEELERRAIWQYSHYYDPAASEPAAAGATVTRMVPT